MSLSEVVAPDVPASAARPSRKRKAESQELEINVDAPEPPSKKAARKAKRKNPDAKLNVIDTKRLTNASRQLEESPSHARSRYGIWIGNLSFSTTKEELHEFLISDVEHPIVEGQITRIHLPLSTARNGPKSQNKGFAYVDLSTSQAHASALQLSEKLVGGRRVLIKSSNDFEGRPDKTQIGLQTSGKPPSSRVFLGNLGFDITKEDLENHFAVCGSVTNVHMATFEDSGKCKGYAWIQFEEVASAAAAVRGWVESSSVNKPTPDKRGFKRRQWVNMINGRKLRAEFAEDKTTRYKKRFGKEVRNESAAAPAAEEALESPTVPHGRVEEPTEEAESVRKNPRENRMSWEEKIGRTRKSNRYTNETVTKLTGAIVPPEGTKTTFD